VLSDARRLTLPTDKSRSSTFFEIDCGDDESVVMERRDDGDLVFHGWDIETELAAQELGFQPSACLVVWDAQRNDRLDEELRAQVLEGHTAVVELLLAAGADVDAKNNYGWTALHYAAAYGHADVVELLLEAGADIKAKNNSGGTALHYAAAYGHADVVELLVSAGANVNAQDKDGWTALFWASFKGYVAVVELLLASGAVDKYALHLAAQGGHAAVVKLIESWIAEHE